MTTDAGGGHRATAGALRAAMHARRPEWVVSIVNPYDEILPEAKPTERLYNKLILRSRWASLLHWNALVPLSTSISRFRANHIRERVLDYWRVTQPDLVVSVMPFANGYLHEGLAGAGGEAPLVVLMTDLADVEPNCWFERGRREIRYLCPTPMAIQQANRAGIDPSDVCALSGVVIDPSFYVGPPSARGDERAELGLDAHVPTVLLAFGMYGSGQMLETVQRIDAAGAEVQFLCLCGRDSEVLRKLQDLRLRHKLVGIPRTTEVARYMSMGDLFIGKPGPGMTTEALVRGLPVITVLDRFTMKQERYTCQWLEENGYGLVLSSFREVGHVVRDIVERDSLKQLQTTVSSYQNTAVFDAANYLERIIESRSEATVFRVCAT